MSYSIELTYPGDHIALITFADPGRQNQLCWAAVDELARCLQESREQGVRAVVLASGLPGHWLQHAWLGDLQAGIEGREQTGTGTGWFAVQEELTHESVVSIAAISGDSSGGGAEFGWACDLRIAESQARFSQPEINMSLTTGIGGCSRLSHLAGPSLAADMVLTGRPVSAPRLYRAGAITRLVESGGALAAALALAAELASRSPEALAGLKRILGASARMDLPEALRFEQQTFQSVAGTDAARAGMRAVQAAYDRGATIAEANNYPDDGAIE